MGEELLLGALRREMLHIAAGRRLTFDMVSPVIVPTGRGPDGHQRSASRDTNTHSLRTWLPSKTVSPTRSMKGS